MGDAAPGARAGRSLPRPRRRRAKARKALRPVRKKGPVWRASGNPKSWTDQKAGRNPGPQPRPEPGPSPPEASPAQPPLPPLLPSPGGAGREHKRLQLPSGHRPTPNSRPGPGGPIAGELRTPGGQGRARVAPGRRPGAAGLGGSTEGGGPRVTPARRTPSTAKRKSF